MSIAAEMEIVVVSTPDISREDLLEKVVSWSKRLYRQNTSESPSDFKKLEIIRKIINEPEILNNCDHCNNTPGISTMLRWNWKYCPECGIKFMKQ